MVGSEQGEIGRSDVERRKFRPRCPGQFGVFEGSRRRGSGGEPANKGSHEDFDPGVGVGDVGKGFDDLHPAAEFFLKFAVKGFGGGFAGIDLAAGKFPEACEQFAGGTAGDEDLREGRVPDEGADNGSGGHGMAEGGLRRLDFSGDFWWNRGEMIGGRSGC